jgi:hypothetical protein
MLNGAFGTQFRLGWLEDGVDSMTWGWASHDAQAGKQV